MDTLQAELATTYPILDIQIVGINEFGQDPAGANDLMTANRTTPWLQDVDANANQTSDVWYDLWGVAYRDVIILDGQNEVVDVYNLTVNNLGDTANYESFRGKLIDAAMAEQLPWQNHRDRFDIDDDGFVVPRDVLIMINEINETGPRDLLPPTGNSVEGPFWDCNGDNIFAPIDILQVINYIEDRHDEGEGNVDLISDVAIAHHVMPTTATSLPAANPSIVIAVMDVAPISITDPTVPASTIHLDMSAEDRLDQAEPNDDDYWARYWPSL